MKSLEERQKEWDNEHTGINAELNMERYKYGRPERPSKEFDDLCDQMTQPVGNYVEKLKKLINPILDNELIQDTVSGCLNACIDEMGNESSVLICKGIDNDGRTFQVHVKITYDQAEFIDDNFEELRTYNVSEDNRLIESPKYTNEEYLDLHGSAENAYLKNKITTQEYFKLDEQKRALYMRFCGTNEVYYIVSPTVKK